MTVDPRTLASSPSGSNLRAKSCKNKGTSYEDKIAPDNRLERGSVRLDKERRHETSSGGPVGFLREVISFIYDIVD